MRITKLNSSLVALIFIVSSTFGVAQAEVVDAGLQAEIDRETQQLQQVEETQVADPQPRVVIINPQTNQVQQQPVTNVEASPLTLSRAELLRKARREAELGTEQKIVEKLEKSRLQDEQRRAQALFGNTNLGTNQIQQQQQVQQQPQTVQVVQVEKEQTENLSDVKEDIINSVRDELSKQKEEKREEYFVSASVGTTEYEGAVLNTIDSRISSGFSVGMNLEGGFTVEGAFMYSNFYISRDFWGFRSSLFEELDQYNTTLAVKYSPFSGRVRPQVGALIGYTYREYTQQNVFANQFRYGLANEAKTDAIDMGFIAGLDVVISKKFTIGAEFRYMTNLTNKTDSPFSDPNIRNNRIVDPLEELDYSTLQVVGKFLF